MGLDIYLLRKIYIGAGTGSQRINIAGSIDIKKNGKSVPVELDRILEITECVGYWRKFAALHQWMLDNVFSGKSDCFEHAVPFEALSKLESDCESIISAGEEWINQAQKIFPHLCFENATDDQLNDFISEIHHTFQIMSDLSQPTKDDAFYYRASW